MEVVDNLKMELTRGKRLKILSLSTVFPNVNEPGLGSFVLKRLARIGELADLLVVAPVALVDYTNPKRKPFSAARIPSEAELDDLRIRHPRWFYPPGGTVWNPLLMLLCLLCPLVKLRREFHWDVIDAHFGYPEGVVAGLLSRLFATPYTVTMRGSEIPFSRRRLRRWCIAWALRRASGVITVSDELAALAEEMGVDPRKIRVIPNGIEKEVFYRREPQECRRRHGLPELGPVLITVGELIRAKGHHRVIRAVSALRHQGIEVTLVVAGGVARGGPRYEEVLHKLVTDLGLESHVHFTGWVPPEDLAGLFSAADVSCLASDVEGWPNVVMEALSCGTPVVAARVGAVPEMIPDDRIGLTVPVDDDKALTAALRDALTRTWDRELIEEQGRSRSWERVAEEAVEELLSAANKNAPPANSGNRGMRVQN